MKQTVQTVGNVMPNFSEKSAMTNTQFYGREKAKEIFESLKNND